MNFPRLGALGLSTVFNNLCDSAHMFFMVLWSSKSLGEFKPPCVAMKIYFTSIRNHKDDSKALNISFTPLLK